MSIRKLFAAAVGCLLFLNRLMFLIDSIAMFDAELVDDDGEFEAIRAQPVLLQEFGQEERDRLGARPVAVAEVIREIDQRHPPRGLEAIDSRGAGGRLAGDLVERLGDPVEPLGGRQDRDVETDATLRLEREQNLR